CQQGNTYPYTF
nr:immunoglobulin light chain junction region [Macaca mulatta]MOX08066.1 immunoglobulin light chain junction region [Macaca mulatta]MOX08169.1 immunoglobulin light chain junction region [Macaca mulatta]MOX08722.1 immunoglobulin light chain junction region [Macaca mulatta]MOX09242.1 immunoglobulin light chain junction region [Macaca mulatta]